MSDNETPLAVQVLDYLLWLFLTIAGAAHVVRELRGGHSEWWGGISVAATLVFFANSQQSASEFRKRGGRQ